MKTTMKASIDKYSEKLVTAFADRLLKGDKNAISELTVLMGKNDPLARLVFFTPVMRYRRDKKNAEKHKTRFQELVCLDIVSPMFRHMICECVRKKEVEILRGNKKLTRLILDFLNSSENSRYDAAVGLGFMSLDSYYEATSGYASREID